MTIGRTIPLESKSPLSSRLAALPDPIFLNPTRIRSPRTHIQLRTMSSSSSSSPSLTNPLTSNVLFASKFGDSDRQVDPTGFRVSAESGGGGGGGSGGGSSGDSGGGGNEGESGGKNDGSFLSWYLNLLSKYPVTTNSVTSGLLTLIGDLICQIAIEQVPSLDLNRTFVFTLLGLVFVGPILHFWYLYLCKLVTLEGVSATFLRLLLDQFLFSPIYIGVFLALTVTLEGNPSQVIPRLQQEWFSTTVINWLMWVPFQFLNFQFIPLKFQVLAVSLVSVIWNAILSFKAHEEILPKMA